MSKFCCYRDIGLVPYGANITTDIQISEGSYYLKQETESYTNYVPLEIIGDSFIVIDTLKFHPNREIYLELVDENYTSVTLPMCGNVIRFFSRINNLICTNLEIEKETSLVNNDDCSSSVENSIIETISVTFDEIENGTVVYQDIELPLPNVNVVLDTDVSEYEKVFILQSYISSLKLRIIVQNETGDNVTLPTLTFKIYRI